MLANTAERRSPQARLLLCLALSVFGLSGCGGGGTTDSEQDVVTNGRIYPAAAGMIVVEYGGNGTELQRSTPSTDDGSFQFRRRLSGERLEAVYTASTERVQPVYSSQLRGMPARTTQLEITPLTTWYDQLVVNGWSPTNAASKVQGLVATSCPALQGQLDARYLNAYAILPVEHHDWLLAAAAAYLQGAHDLGIGPKIDFVGWSGALERHDALLSQLCAFTAGISTADWAKAQVDRLKLEAQAQTIDTALLSAAILNARSQVLTALARQIQQAAYPEQTAVLLAANNIGGRELTLASDFVIAHYLRVQSSEPSAQGLTGVPAIAGVKVTSSGAVVDTLQGSVTATGDASASLRLINGSPSDKQLRLAINDQSMADLPDIIEQIVALPVAYPGEPLYRKAWRYLMAHKRNTKPLARSNFQFQPDLWLRSVGSSYCEAQAAALYRIWQAMGYEARVHALSGHVTVEIMIDGRWQVFDPYLQVYYTDRQGHIVGVAELEQDPTLVASPQTPLLPLSDIAYSSTVADIFGTADDNSVGSYFMSALPQPMDSVVQIPAGGYLEVDARTDVTLDSMESGFQVSMSTMRLWVPPGYTGTIQLPSLLLDVKGAGSVQLFGRTVDASGAIIETRGLAGLGSLDASTTDIRARLQHFYFNDGSTIGVTEIKVSSSGSEGLTLTLLVNPLYFRTSSQRLTALAYGANLEGLRLETAPRSQ
jgi:hypothetical protein